LLVSPGASDLTGFQHVANGRVIDEDAAIKARATGADEEPAGALNEHDECIAHVLGCLDKMRRGEDITRVEALKAEAWLRDVPGEAMLPG